MDELIRLIPQTTVRELKTQQTVAVILALQRAGKNVTGKTIRSIRSDSSIVDESLEIDTVGGGWVEYIIDGKPAGTKLPVENVGGEFRLVRDLENWKNVVGFGGTDFQLARHIADNPRPGVDIPGLALEIYGDTASDLVSDIIATKTLERFGKDFNNQP